VPGCRRDPGHSRRLPQVRRYSLSASKTSWRINVETPERRNAYGATYADALLEALRIASARTVTSLWCSPGRGRRSAPCDLDEFVYAPTRQRAPGPHTRRARAAIHHLARGWRSVYTAPASAPGSSYPPCRPHRRAHRTRRSGSGNRMGPHPRSRRHVSIPAASAAGAHCTWPSPSKPSTPTPTRLGTHRRAA